MPTTLKRILWLDFIRVISIYFVLVIHSQIWNLSVSNLTLGVFISSSVPLFIMVSGALLLGKKETYSNFFKKRVNKVLIPWLFWTFIYMFWHYSVDKYYISSFSSLKYFFEKTFLSELWFLPMIFGLYILTPVLKIFIQNSKLKDIFYFVFIWFIAVSFLPSIHPGVTFPNYLSGLAGQILQYAGYFILGYGLLIIKIPKNKFIIPLVLITLGVFLTIFGPIYPQLFRKIGDLGFFSPNIVIVSSGLFLLIKGIFIRYENKISKKWQNLIIALSKASFGIYLIHELLMFATKSNFLSFLSFLKQIDPIFTGPLLALIYFSLSFFIIFIIQKLPILKHLVP